MTKKSVSETTIIGIIGGGSFGTALANIIAQRGFEVRQWMRSRNAVDQINKTHENSVYLPGFAVHSGITATNDIEAMIGCDLIFIAIPSTSFRQVVRNFAGILGNASIITTTKGIESETFYLMSEILHQEVPGRPIGVLSGPNFAREIMKKCITATVIASEDQSLCKQVQTILHCEHFRVYANDDRIGVELGGALKNIYAIMSGLATSLEMGENTKSMLIARALAEMARFGLMVGANPITFMGLSGVGDLIVTCSSKLSRNFRVGYELGQGKALDAIQKELGQVAEGINTLKLTKEKAQEKQVNMPIVNGLYEIIFNKKPVSDAIDQIMITGCTKDVEFTAN